VTKAGGIFLSQKLGMLLLVTQQPALPWTNGWSRRIQGIKLVGDAVRGCEKTLGGIFTCGIWDAFACSSRTTGAMDKWMSQADSARDIVENGDREAWRNFSSSEI
jgi:hypothetical protein